MTNPTENPSGTYFANALAFIVESITEENAESTNDIRVMDHASLLEFAEMYNFDMPNLYLALNAFQIASQKEHFGMS